jgi:hypothetical protein
MTSKPKQSSLKVSRPLFAVLLVMMLAPAAVAQVDQWGAWENGVTESWQLSSRTFTNEEAAAAIDRWKRIGAAESDEAAANWTGDYFVGGETHGTYLRWSANGGFVIANIDKCQAMVMGVTYGRVEASPGLITFFPEFSKSSKSHGHMHSGAPEAAALTFIPVKWQNELFLISLSEITDFTDYVAGLGDFNTLNGFDPSPESLFFSKYAGKNAVVYETPILPEPYQHLIRKPVTGSIIAVGNTRLKRNYAEVFASKIVSGSNNYELASLTFVTVDVGSRDGATVGLILCVLEPEADETIRLIRVGRKSSTGVIVTDASAKSQSANEAESEKPSPELAAGWKLTTARRWQ